MAKQGCKTIAKIRAAKGWLNRAEENFDREAPLSGQLDLLIAEAELRSTREAIDAGPDGPKSCWIRHGLALALALLLAFGAGGVWWLVQEPVTAAAVPVSVVVPTTAASTASTPSIVSTIPAAVSPTPLNKSSTVPAQKPEPAPAAAVDPTIPRQEVNNVRKSAEQENPVSQDEMKRLIQTAGQSLRGRTKQ